MTLTQEAAVSEILRERRRQDLIHGDESHEGNHFLLTVLLEEVGEVAKAIQEKDTLGIHDELIQVAAVCVRWMGYTSDKPSATDALQKVVNCDSQLLVVFASLDHGSPMWFTRLTALVGHAAYSVAGDHSRDLHDQLTMIAAACVAWLERGL